MFLTWPEVRERGKGPSPKGKWGLVEQLRGRLAITSTERTQPLRPDQVLAAIFWYLPDAPRPAEVA